MHLFSLYAAFIKYAAAFSCAVSANRLLSVSRTSGHLATVAALRTVIPSLRCPTNRKRGLISPRRAKGGQENQRSLLNEKTSQQETSVLISHRQAFRQNKGLFSGIWGLPSGSPPAGHRNGGEYLWRRVSAFFRRDSLLSLMKDRERVNCRYCDSLM